METLLEKLLKLKPLIGQTPLVSLGHPHLSLYCKLEYYNLSGSIKDRVAFYALQKAIERGMVTQNTTIVESSSGNFASSLAQICHSLGINFIPVVDPNINKPYYQLLKNLCSQVEMVTERDDTGGFLKTRLNRVEEIRRSQPHAYWINQYGNSDCADAHYYGTGAELADHLPQLDYLFIGVSTGGTLAGVSRKIKEVSPITKVIAVDAEGSVIFGATPKKRFIPGLGSSIVPALISSCLIDEVIHVREQETVIGCQELSKQGIFAGGSSGTVYYAINKYFQNRMLPTKPTVAFLCPDRGTAYLDTVYNEEWIKKLSALD